MSSLLIVVKSHTCSLSLSISIRREEKRRQLLAVGTGERGEVAAVNRGGRALMERGGAAGIALDRNSGEE